MAMTTVKRPRAFGFASSGIKMTPREFDRCRFAEGWRYELIHGVLIANPTPLPQDRDMNEELGHSLRSYQAKHPHQARITLSLPEDVVQTSQSRRRADRAIWIGLRRMPRPDDSPAIIVEFICSAKRDRKRDYKEKREEYQALGVKEYWLVDRFQRTMTVFFLQAGPGKKRIVTERQLYATDLLPGFELPLARLFALADRWPKEE